jgi:membrane protein implicated in regulation of membrane protease activity
MMWQAWWVWVAGGLLLAGLELLVPGYIFVGFAAGALATGLLLGLGVHAQTFPLVLLVFAVISIGMWLALRRILGVRRGQVKRIDRDINEN